MGKPSQNPGPQRTSPLSFGTLVLVVALLGLLAAAAWFAVSAWMSVQGPPMPEAGYVAMTLGVVFSLLVGFALMGLLFYSSRHGYDDRVNDESYSSGKDRD